MVIQSTVGIQHIFADDVSGSLRLLAELCHAGGTCRNQRVQFLGGFPEYLHTERIAFRFVFQLAECVDDLPVNRVTVPQIAVCIKDRNP